MVRFKNRYILIQVVPYAPSSSSSSSSSSSAISNPKSKALPIVHKSASNRVSGFSSTSVTLNPFSRDELISSLKEEILKNFGELGLSLIYSNLQIRFPKYDNTPTSIGIIRVARSAVKIAQISLDAMLLRKHNTYYKVDCIHISGTIAKCRKRAEQYGLASILTAMEGDEEAEEYAGDDDEEVDSDEEQMEL